MTTDPSTLPISRAPRPRQRGFALLMGLCLLVVGSLLAVNLYRGIGIQGRIAGNTLEKQRSLQVAESALRYGEWWLSQGVAGTGFACSGVFDANDLGAMKVCTAPLTDAMVAAGAWTAGGTYQPAGLTVQAGGGRNSDGDVLYATAPMIYITFLGTAADGRSNLYQVNAMAQGGSESTATVVRSVFMTSQRIRNLGEP